MALTLELTIGEALRILRMRKGLTQAELGRRSFISTNWLMQIECGHAQAKPDHIKALESALGARLTDADPAPPAPDLAGAITQEYLAQRIAQAVANEREACALLVDQAGDQSQSIFGKALAAMIAGSIRARGPRIQAPGRMLDVSGYQYPPSMYKAPPMPFPRLRKGQGLELRGWHWVDTDHGDDS